MILGIDEVGRGPWAGPLVVGAVVLGVARIEGLTDSKKLSKKKLLQYDKLIRESALGIGLGWVSSDEIDDIGLSEALRLATIRAVEQVKTPYHEIIIDGTVNFLRETSKEKYVTTMKKADLLISSVSAASIVAKVARDNYMASQSIKYPQYGFEDHVGYGTAKHAQALASYGVTSLHRKSFAPIKLLLQDKQPKTKHVEETHLTDNTPRTTKQVGDKAEDLASKYLEGKGFTVTDRNWKTKFCEIDIIAHRENIVYFVEVKYRKLSKWGDGLDAVGKAKLRQMKFAAEFYALKNQIAEHDMRLAVISVSGSPAVVDKYLEV